jgi:hypothetical protein
VNDPHVEALHYKLVLDDGVSFAKGAAPVTRQLPGFTVRLADDELTVTMHDHYSTEQDARRAVDGYLRAWRAHASLATNRAEFEFKFTRSEIVDLNPPPPPPPGSATVIGVTAIASAEAFGTLTLHTTRAAYPEPPTGFALDPDTETLWNRWQGYIEGREPLGSMAYACLTVLQRTGGRAGASARFGISDNVLGKLATLSTETGDLATVRKVTPRLRPRTDAEQVWLEAAVKALVSRAGEVAAAPGATRPQLTMSDLPKL